MNYADDVEIVDDNEYNDDYIVYNESIDDIIPMLKYPQLHPMWILRYDDETTKCYNAWWIWWMMTTEH